jgi:hypothetical protein
MLSKAVREGGQGLGGTQGASGGGAGTTARARRRGTGRTDIAGVGERGWNSWRAAVHSVLRRRIAPRGALPRGLPRTSLLGQVAARVGGSAAGQRRGARSPNAPRCRPRSTACDRRAVTLRPHLPHRKQISSPAIAVGRSALWTPRYRLAVAALVVSAAVALSWIYNKNTLAMINLTSPALLFIYSFSWR